MEKSVQNISLINDLEKQISDKIKIKKLDSKSIFECNDNFYEQKRLIVSDNNFKIELDEQGSLITYLNK